VRAIGYICRLISEQSSHHANQSLMNIPKHLLLLLLVALLTPVAAILGLYESSLEQVLSFVGPVAGAASAILLMRVLRRR
jgi:hypothetical protein